MILLKVGYSGYTEFKYDCVKYVNSLNNTKDTVNKENNKIEKYIDTIELMHYTLMINDEKVSRFSKINKKSSLCWRG